MTLPLTQEISETARVAFRTFILPNDIDVPAGHVLILSLDILSTEPDLRQTEI